MWLCGKRYIRRRSNPFLVITEAHKGSVKMTRIKQDGSWDKFKKKLKEIWLIIYLRVFSPCFTVMGNGIDRFEHWLDRKMDNYIARRQYLKALYNVEPMARVHRDIKHIKILLVITMVCVFVLELAVIF